MSSLSDRFLQQNDTRLLDTISGLEALLGGGNTELTFKLSFRVAGLLGRTAAERVEIFEAMKGYYAARSRVVHGDTLTAKEQRALEDVERARDFLRRLLVASARLAATSAPTYSHDFFSKGGLDATLQDETARRQLTRTLGLSEGGQLRARERRRAAVPQ